MKDKFINVLQGKSGKWIKGDTDIAIGLYTDEIETCKVFIIFGRKNNLPSVLMFHYDGYAKISDILEEYNWFDVVENCFICFKPERQNPELINLFFQELSEQKYIKFEKVTLPVDHDAVIANYTKEGKKMSVIWQQVT